MAAKKNTKKAAVNVNAAIILPYPQTLTGVVDEVTDNVLVMTVKRHRSKKYDKTIVPRTQIAGIFTPASISSLAELVGEEVTVTKMPDHGVYDAFKGDFLSVDEYVGATSEEGTFLGNPALVEISGEDEEALENAKKEKKNAKKDKEKDDKGGKKKPGRPPKKKVEEEEEEEEEDSDDDDDDDDEDGLTADDIMGMNKKQLRALIKENEMEVNPSDFDDEEDLKEAIIDELGLE